MSISVIVISKKEDHVASINMALRDAGHATHCHLLEDFSEFVASLKQFRPELILLIDTGHISDLAQAAQHCSSFGAHIPLLLVSENTGEEAIARAMAAGARDVVSLEHITRLQAVATRELRAYRLETVLERVISTANRYKTELESLKKVTTEAIAEVQEGIIVNANPAWIQLFCHKADTDLTGTPIMDMCSAKDKAALKGGIVAVQHGKWKDEKLEVNGIDANGIEFPVAFNLEEVLVDDEPAIRMMVKPEKVVQSTPTLVMRHAIHTDSVTGLYKRTHFTAMAEKRLSHEPEGGIRVLAYIRIDSFSRVTNDIGILGTDDILAGFARLMKSFVQPTDIYCRFGGTMFAVLLERGTVADAEAWADQLTKAVKDSVFEFGVKSTMLTCSIGLASPGPEHKKFNELLVLSELACRNARESGGNRIEFSEINSDARQEKEDETIWVPKIRNALMENRFRLEHQPVAGLNGEIEDAFDILVRMLDESGETILPGEFMPVAARTGLTKNIDRWVIGASISYCLTSKPSLIFVRLSRDSLLDDSLPVWLAAQIERHSLQPSRICFEVSEPVVVKHLAQTQEMSEKLRKLGFGFALEHCGQGDETEHVISKIKMNYMKIDGSLMQGLHKNAPLQAQVKSLVQTARDHEIETVAERVQDANTMAVLWQLGIDYIQGNYVQKRDIVLEDTTNSTVTTRALELVDQ